MFRTLLVFLMQHPVAALSLIGATGAFLPAAANAAASSNYLFLVTLGAIYILGTVLVIALAKRYKS